MELINNIKLSLTRTDYTEDDYKDDWKKTSNKYKARITYNKKSMTIIYYTGSGWKKRPRIRRYIGKHFTGCNLFRVWP